MSGTAEADRLQRIREVAYDLWERDGRPGGREHEFWLRAEALVDGTVERPDPVDRDSEAGFPASDPPSFTP
jgi:hypothetical protein